MKKDTLPRLTPAEFEIMNTVWEAGEITATEIQQEINTKQGRDLRRATIQVQLGRLEEKGWLTHRKEGNKFIFLSTTPRNEAAASIAHDIGERIFNGSRIKLFKALFSKSGISPDEIRQMRKLLDEYED